MRPRALALFRVKDKEEGGVGLAVAERPRKEEEVFWRLVAQTGLMEGFGDVEEGGGGRGASAMNGNGVGDFTDAGGGAPEMPEDAEGILQAHAEADYEETGDTSGSSDTDMDTEPSDGQEAHAHTVTPANNELEPEEPEEPEEESLAAQFEFNASSSSSTSHPHPSTSISTSHTSPGASHPSSPHIPTPEESRRLARIKVYNLRYLNPQRLWGPFMHLRDEGALMFGGEGALEGRTHVWVEGGEEGEGVSEDDGEGDDRDEGEEEGEGGAGGSGSGSGGGGQGGHTHSLQLIELAEIDEDDVEDPDYVDASDMFEVHDSDEDPMEHSSTSSHSSHSSRSSNTHGHGADHGDTDARSGKRHSKKKQKKIVTAMDLKFDWNWLCAARQVVEGNLRDLLLKRHVRALRALVCLDGLRMGSAPGMDVERILRERERERRRMSDGRDSSEEDGKWDWAGVEGQWR